MEESKAALAKPASKEKDESILLIPKKLKFRGEST